MNALDLQPVIPADGSLLSVFHHVRELVLGTLDPVELAINESCRRHHIRPAHARGRGQDQVTVANRRAVMIDLMQAGFSDLIILENFQTSKRAVERLRAEWRRKGGGVLALGNG